MKKIIALSIMLLAFAQPILGESPQLDSYRNKHATRTFGAPLPSCSESMDRQSSVRSPSFDDVRINTDSESERFRQQHADVGVFPDSRYVVVWEDDRNGDFDIYAQIFAANNQPIGDNVRLVEDARFADQRMPSCDTDDGGNLVVAWVDEDGNLYGRIFDEDLSPVTDSFEVNDNPGENLCNLPDVMFLSGGGVGFVWEDSRATQNVYCQLYDAFYEPINSNFQINTSIPNSSFWSPHIVSGGGSGFAVSWDVLTSSGASVLMRTHAADGTPTSGLILLPDPASGTHDRFQTSLTHLDETGYAAFWIDTRDGGQVVYGQIIDYNGNKNGSNFVICDNTDYISWDVSSAESDNGSLLVVWASYGARAEILGTRLTAQGARDGSNITISDPTLFLDRFYPKADIGNDDLPVVVWTDLRDEDHDTYRQRLDAAGGRSGANAQVPSAETGAHQTSPDIAYLGADSYAAVWNDMRHDAGDIYIQFGNSAGTPLGGNQKVNQDDAAYSQSDPAIGGASNGYAVVAWQDARDDGEVFGWSIFARRYSSARTALGDEMRVSDEISTAVKTEPDAAQCATGRAMVVWRDARNGQNDIYGQKLSSGGFLDGANFKVNSEPSLTDNYSPKVGMNADNNAVIAWRSVTDGIGQVYFQLYGADGAPLGSNVPVVSGRSTASQTDFDLAVDPGSGEFVIAWIKESDSNGAAVMAQRYTNLGILVDSSMLLSNLPAAGGEDISAAIDASGNYTVSWTDSRSSFRRAYMVTVQSDNTVGIVTPIAGQSVDARSEHSSVAMTGTDILAVWSDNRDSGEGYDIYANSRTYSSTPADEIDDPLIPSDFMLAQNYPNPFNPTTVIRFYMPESGKATLDIHNVLGQVVKTQSWDRLMRGWHEYTYEASNQPSGVYFYRLQTGYHSESKKMIFLK